MKNRNVRLMVWVALLLVHGAISMVAMMEVGFLGIFEEGLATWGTRQVFSDLTVGLVLVSIWLVRDARERKVSAWPFLVAMLGAGTFSPLFYLLWRDLTAVEGSRAALPA